MVVGTVRKPPIVYRLMRTPLVAVLLAATLASCTSSSIGEAPAPASPPTSSTSPIPKTSPVGQPVTDYASFTEALAEAGFTVEHGDRTGTDLFAVPGQAVLIDRVQVYAYEYPNQKALDEVRSSISPDGYSLGTPSGGSAIVEWVATPHFFAAGKLLVVYVGDTRRTLKALRLLLGAQFAGGSALPLDQEVW
jgi:hypothetical protein